MIEVDPRMFDSMTTARIHVFGAAGAGVTTLTLALADHLRYPHFDTDDYLWPPTDPPYQEKRALETRVEWLLRDTQAPTWVLGGSLLRWGDAVIPRFTLAVFVTLDRERRLMRLRARERQRFGSRIDPGGDMHHIHIKLLEWAAGYDSDRLDMRTGVLHEQWIATLLCPVVRIDGARPTFDQVQIVMAELDGLTETVR